jgi:hypothetical protein
VKEKFTANYGEAPDLSWTRAFESHPYAAAEPKKSNHLWRLSGFCHLLVNPSHSTFSRYLKRRSGEQNESGRRAAAFEAGKSRDIHGKP